MNDHGAAYIAAGDELATDITRILTRIEHALDNQRATLRTRPGRVCQHCHALTRAKGWCDVCRWIELTHLYDEIEFLNGTDHPLNIAKRLGYQDHTALVRRLNRAGRADLARIFDIREMVA